jgi:hypothetical protein
MEIQELGAWGELIGGVASVVAAIAVVATLIYLARQIQQNTTSAKSSAYAAFIASNAAVHQTHMQAIGVLTKYLNGEADEWEYDSEDYMRFHGHATQVFYNVELAFLLYNDGTVDEEYFDSRMRLLKQSLELPGLRWFWENHGHYFYDRRFYEYGNAFLQG